MINRIYGGPADGLAFETPNFCQPPEFLYCLLVDYDGAVQITDHVASIHPLMLPHYSTYRLTEFVRGDHATFRFQCRTVKQMG